MNLFQLTFLSIQFTNSVEMESGMRLIIYDVSVKDIEHLMVSSSVFKLFLFSSFFK